MLAKYKWGAIIAIVLAGLFTIIFLQARVHSLQAEVDRVTANEKALLKDNVSWKDKYGKLHTESQVLTLNREQLADTNDSLLNKINDYVKTIKNTKRVTGAGVITSRIDTQWYPRPFQYRDTCVTFGDEYVINKICIKDSTIAAKLYIYNEQVLVWKNSRETIAPRKKFFIARWFQRKHTVVNVEVKNSNPYITQQYTRFVNFVK